jgi:hypothetical protein
MKSLSHHLQGRLVGLALRVLRGVSLLLRRVLAVPRTSASHALVPVRIESRSDPRRVSRRRS